MSSTKWLASLKSAQLKRAAFLMGISEAGTKPELASTLAHTITRPSALTKANRIVSIDMGIKNLGICVLEAPGLTQSHGAAASATRVKDSMLRMVHWKKLDLLNHLSLPGEAALVSLDDSIESDGHQARARDEERCHKKLSISAAAAQSFTPASLSRTALVLAQYLLNTYNPTHILIERQRFRTGGAPAVQEWTLRVNLLEGMLWACLETLRACRQHTDKGRKTSSFPEVDEVSPARVARFWCGIDIPTTVPSDLLAVDWTEEARTGSRLAKVRKKIEKKDKLAVVRSWLSESTNKDDVHLELSNEAKTISQAVLSGSESGRKSKASEKLDDLADCLLQAVAWVRWEENRQRMRLLLESRD